MPTLTEADVAEMTKRNQYVKDCALDHDSDLVDLLREACADRDKLLADRKFFTAQIARKDEALKPVRGFIEVAEARVDSLHCECDSYHGYTCGKHGIVEIIQTLAEALRRASSGMEDR